MQTSDGSIAVHYVQLSLHQCQHNGHSQYPILAMLRVPVSEMFQNKYHKLSQGQNTTKGVVVWRIANQGVLVVEFLNVAQMVASAEHQNLIDLQFLVGSFQKQIRTVKAANV